MLKIILARVAGKNWKILGIEVKIVWIGIWGGRKIEKIKGRRKNIVRSRIIKIKRIGRGTTIVRRIARWRIRIRKIWLIDWLIDIIFISLFVIFKFNNNKIFIIILFIYIYMCNFINYTKYNSNRGCINQLK